MIQYRTFNSERLDEVMHLYEQEGWDLYTTYSEKVRPAFERSIYRMGAFDNNVLIGFIRCTGDGEFDVYVDDLIVDVGYRKKGIGKKLLQLAMDHFSEVDTFALMTGLEEADNCAFYKAMGMKEYQQNRLIGFLR